jgi:myosin heavy subunit
MKVLKVERLEELARNRLRTLRNITTRDEIDSYRGITREKWKLRLKTEIALIESILRNERQFDINDIKPRNFVLNAFAQGGIVDMDYAGIEIRTMAEYLPQSAISILNEEVKAKDDKIVSLQTRLKNQAETIREYIKREEEKDENVKGLHSQIEKILSEANRYQSLYFEERNKNKDTRELTRELDHYKTNLSIANKNIKSAHKVIDNKNKQLDDYSVELKEALSQKDLWKTEAQRLEKLVHEPKFFEERYDKSQKELKAAYEKISKLEDAPKKQSVLDLFVNIVHDNAEVEKLKKKVNQQAERIIVQTEELAARRYAVAFEGSEKLEIIRLDAERRKAWRLYFYFKSILDKLGIKY